MVICNKKDHCSMRHECGGAKPHERCSECGKCPKAARLKAECVEVKENKC